jgi:hypothetical protein
MMVVDAGKDFDVSPSPYISYHCGLLTHVLSASNYVSVRNTLRLLRLSSKFLGKGVGEQIKVFSTNQKLKYRLAIYG